MSQKISLILARICRGSMCAWMETQTTLKVGKFLFAPGIRAALVGDNTGIHASILPPLKLQSATNIRFNYLFLI